MLLTARNLNVQSGRVVEIDGDQSSRTPWGIFQGTKNGTWDGPADKKIRAGCTSHRPLRKCVGPSSAITLNTKSPPAPIRPKHKVESEQSMSSDTPYSLEDVVPSSSLRAEPPPPNQWRGRTSGRRIEHERRRRGDKGIKNSARRSSRHDGGKRKRKLIGNLVEVDDILGCTVRGEDLKSKEWDNREVAESRL